MKVKFFGNKINIKLADLTPGLPSSTISEPDHEYGTGLGSPSHVCFNSEYLNRDTPEWDDADKKIKSHFGGKIGLHDLASAYHIPGMKNQDLNISHFDNGDFSYKPSININYNGKSSNSDERFRYSLSHDIEDDGKHSVHWGWMGNKDLHGGDKGDSSMLPKLMKRLTPVYKKAGINHIDTEAAGGSCMNGNHTWATMGFGFRPALHNSSEPYDLAMAKREAYYQTKNLGIDNDEMKEKINSATHPFHFQEIAKKIANSPENRKNSLNYNGREMYNKMVPDFDARLSMDPNDVGHQKLQKFLSRLKA